MAPSVPNGLLLNVTVQGSSTGCYLSERAFLHGIAAGLMLAHDSLLWYIPSGQSLYSHTVVVVTLRLLSIRPTLVRYDSAESARNAYVP